MVTGLTAGDRTPTSIALSWTNPTDADLAEVIVRRAKGPVAPGSATAGTGVYLGPWGPPTGPSVTDTGLDPNTGYSYAVFTRDTTGNISSPTTLTTSTTSPPKPIGPETIIAGYIHTCGLDVAGKAWCWGDGSSGQLGDVFDFSHDTGTPVAVVGGHTFVGLTAGSIYAYHTCGLDDAGKAWCWGFGYYGQFGDGNSSDHTVRAPVAVVGGHTFTQLTAGTNHTCGLDGAGTAWCWGDGYYGQLGDGNSSAHATGTPVAVVGGHTITQLDRRRLPHVRDRRQPGRPGAGAAETSGRLGDGNTSDHVTATPVAVVGGHTITQLTTSRAPHMRDRRRRESVVLGLRKQRGAG